MFYSIYTRENIFFVVTLIMVAALQVIVQYIPVSHLPNAFLSFAAFLIAFPVPVGYGLLFFLATAVFAPLGVYALPYVGAFGASFLISWVLVRKYFEPGSWYAILYASVVSTIVMFGFYWIATATIYHAAKKPYTFGDIGVEVVLNAALAAGIAGCAKITRSFRRG